MSFLNQLSELKQVAADCASLEPQIDQSAALVVGALEQGNKILACGNGGSAADAMHLIEELVGRYCSDRKSLPGICFNADPTILTCIANDYGYDEVFARQVTGLGAAGDILVAFSTSGNSPNVVRALAAAAERGIRSILLTGKDGGKAAQAADVALIIPSSNTARIQELHTVILHYWLEIIEAKDWQ